MTNRSPTPRASRSAAWSVLVAGVGVWCLLSAAAPCLARPPAQPLGPVAPAHGSSAGSASATGLALSVIPWTVYAAAAAIILGGTALYAAVSLRRDSKERSELMGRTEIDLFAQHAEALAVLIGKYRDRFLDQRPLWASLAADERKHSRWIGEFPARIRGGEASLRRELFPYGRVSSALEQAQQLAREAGHADLTEKTALRNVLQQEKERASWQVPELFAVSSGKFGTTLALLQSEAQAHQHAISGAIEQG